MIKLYIGGNMKLITFQTMDALKDLVNNGYLECKEKYVNDKKYGATYLWMLEKMKNRVLNKFNTKYPIWCWVKFKSGICPPKKKGDKIKGYDVKITFNKAKYDVFITDFRRYSFLLNNLYIPDQKTDKEVFEKDLKKYNITREDLQAFIRPDKYITHRTDREFLEICDRIRKSFDKCITCDSDVLQGCVWRINLEDIEKIEILNDDGYKYGSCNYVRSNGTRFDWIDDFYKKLK